MKIIPIAQVPTKKQRTPILDLLRKIPKGKAGVFRGKEARGAKNAFYRYRKRKLVPKTMSMKEIYRGGKVRVVYVLNP